MAEHVFRRMVEEAGLADVVEVDSAGTSDGFAGYSADPRTAGVLAAAGYESAHTARQFRARWFRSRDLVVALDVHNEGVLRRMAVTDAEAGKVVLLRPYDRAAGDVNVPDPYLGTEATFVECLGMVEAACRGLLKTVGRAYARPL